MSSELSLAGFFTGFFLGMPLTIAYLAGLVLSMMAKKRLGNAANFAMSGFAFFLVAQSIASVVACVTWFLAPSASRTSMVFISLIVERLLCGFLQMVALGLLITAFFKRVNSGDMQAAPSTGTVRSAGQAAGSMPAASAVMPQTQTQTRVQGDTVAGLGNDSNLDGGADLDTQTRTRIEK